MYGFFICMLCFLQVKKKEMSEEKFKFRVDSMSRIYCYECSDGEIFKDRNSAVVHQAKLNICKDLQHDGRYEHISESCVEFISENPDLILNILLKHMNIPLEIGGYDGARI